MYILYLILVGDSNFAVNYCRTACMQATWHEPFLSNGGPQQIAPPHRMSTFINLQIQHFVFRILCSLHSDGVSSIVAPGKVQQRDVQKGSGS